MENEILKSILTELKDIKQNLKEQNTVKTLDANDVSDIMHINVNASTRILKQYGYKYGHLAIEQSKLKEILHNGNGDLLK